MDARIRRATSAVNEWLESRAPRERRLIVAGTIVGAVALVYNVLWAPAWDGSEHLRRTLPTLQASLVQLHVQAGQVRSLRSAAAIRPLSGAGLQAALLPLLSDAGIRDPKVAVVGQSVQVDAKGVLFSAWMACLEEVRVKLHARVVDAHATAEAKPGLVTVSATLQSPAEP